jgi:CBS domain containing-hemolysin-like protein
VTIFIAMAGVVLLVLTLLASALTLSLRQFSRFRLAELLKSRDQEDRFDRLIEDRAMFILTTSTVRMACNLGIMLILVRAFEARLRSVPPEDAAGTYALIFLISGALILVFSVAIPNAWARHGAEALIAPCIPMLHALRIALSPVVVFLHLFDGLVRRILGAPKEDEVSDADVLEREILNMVSEGERTGAVDVGEKEMIESVIELRDRQVVSIMTPRTEIIGIPADATYEDVRQTVIREGHSRMPVFEETIDNILGMLYVKDLLRVESPETFDVREIMRKVPFVPETKSLRDLLREFQEQKVHIAIVADEYGGTAGIVTIEDILEELVGEIVDEYEVHEPEPIQRIDERTVDVDARVGVTELNDAIGLRLPEDAEYDTVGGFVFSHLGRIPEPGYSFEHDAVRITILEAEERRVVRLRVARILAPSEPTAAES